MKNYIVISVPNDGDALNEKYVYHGVLCQSFNHTVQVVVYTRAEAIKKAKLFRGCAIKLLNQ